MQVAAKALKLGGQEHGIGMVHLLGCIAAPPARSSHSTMRFKDLVQFDAA